MTSLGSRDLIRSMLTVNGERRITMAQIKAHPWVCDSLRPSGSPLRWTPAPPPLRLHLTPGTLNDSFVRRLSQDFNLGSEEAIRTQLLFEQDSHAYAIYRLMEERRREALEQAETNHLAQQLQATDLDSPMQMNPIQPMPSTPVKRRFTGQQETRTLGWIELSNSNLHTAIELGDPAPTATGTGGGMGSIISLIGNTLSNKIKSFRRVGGFDSGGQQQRTAPATPLKTPRPDWIP